MRIRPAHLLLCGVLFLSPLAACGKDKKSTDTTTSSTTSTTKADSGSSSGSGNTELTKYCADVEAFAKDAQKALQTKSQSDLKALEPRGNELSERGAKIAPTIKSSDVSQLAACEKKFTDLAQQFAATFGTG